MAFLTLPFPCLLIWTGPQRSSLRAPQESGMDAPTSVESQAGDQTQSSPLPFHVQKNWERDCRQLSHHSDSAFCRNARPLQPPGGKSPLPDTPSERCPSDTPLTPLQPISDTAGRKEINQSRTRGRQEGAQEGERFWVDSSRAMGKWRAGMGRGSSLSLPGGGKLTPNS